MYEVPHGRKRRIAIGAAACRRKVEVQREREMMNDSGTGDCAYTRYVHTRARTREYNFPELRVCDENKEHIDLLLFVRSALEHARACNCDVIMCV